MAEKKYIEVGALFKTVEDYASTHPVMHDNELFALFCSVPAADVRPVVRGKWHSRFYYRESTKSYDCEMRVCSECGSEWSYDAETGLSDFNFCPNCGAMMEES